MTTSRVSTLIGSLDAVLKNVGKRKTVLHSRTQGVFGLFCTLFSSLNQNVKSCTDFKTGNVKNMKQKRKKQLSYEVLFSEMQYL